MIDTKETDSLLHKWSSELALEGKLTDQELSVVRKSLLTPMNEQLMDINTSLRLTTGRIKKTGDNIKKLNKNLKERKDKREQDEQQ